MQLGYMLVLTIYAPALRSEQHEVDDIAARRKLVRPLFERLSVALARVTAHVIFFVTLTRRSCL